MYYLMMLVLYSISLLPFPVLYLLSDFLYLIMYYVVGYRKKTVFDNLRKSFPEKPEQEITSLARKYYHNLTDMMVETIKLMSISKAQLDKRFTCNYELLNELHKTGRSCQLHLGHQFNWEWANLGCIQNVTYPFLVVYMPLTSKPMDRLFRRFRERAGSILINARNIREEMEPWKEKNYLIALVADQNPGKRRRAFWFDFLHQKTLFYKGPEMSARRSDIPVVFADIRKVKRGYYHANLELAFEEPAKTKEGEITGAFVKFLEQRIKEQPETWVWTHRRWKHKWIEGETEV
jgi:Kdo2-lipid IVA lauroyltransferase/acyltransferase